MAHTVKHGKESAGWLPRCGICRGQDWRPIKAYISAKPLGECLTCGWIGVVVGRPSSRTARQRQPGDKKRPAKVGGRVNGVVGRVNGVF